MHPPVISAFSIPDRRPLKSLNTSSTVRGFADIEAPSMLPQKPDVAPVLSRKNARRHSATKETFTQRIIQASINTNMMLHLSLRPLPTQKQSRWAAQHETLSLMPGIAITGTSHLETDNFSTLPAPRTLASDFGLKPSSLHCFRHF